MKIIRNIVSPAIALFGFACLAVAPSSQAVCQNGCSDTNAFLGEDALVNNSTGVLNTAVGFRALLSNTDGDTNTATGANALLSNTTGNDNTATGLDALTSNTTGNFNTAAGEAALGGNTTGTFNTAHGVDALFYNTRGSNNIALGANAGFNLTTGNNNIDIGNTGVQAECNHIRIGTKGTQHATFIAGIHGAAIAQGLEVMVDANGQLGTKPSSERFKNDIELIGKASEAILALKPVTFCYKHELDPNDIPQFGLVAEEVEKVNPDLVAHDEQGKPYTVRYDAVNAMLLNEFLKEHRKVEELQKQVAKLTSGLEKVTARLEASHPEPRVAVKE